MNADGSGQTRLTTSPLPDQGPSWSPDGGRIAFTRYDDVGGVSVSTIMTMTPCGGYLRQLASGGSPDWAPDGQRIAFGGAGPSIRTMNADGSGVTLVIGETLPIPIFHSDPAWSPAGDLIAYTYTSCDRHGCTSWLHTIRPDGTGLAMLALSARDRPSWQPLVAPSPASFKNASKFCKAERERLGTEQFRAHYGSHGGCVSSTGRLR
jgi:Tol biopolymer transport system component